MIVILFLGACIGCIKVTPEAKERLHAITQLEEMGLRLQLDHQGNPITSKSLHSSPNHIKNNFQLSSVHYSHHGNNNCFFTENEIDKALNLILKFPEIHMIDFQEMFNFKDAHLARIAKLQKIKSLTLSYSQVTDVGIKKLAEQPHSKSIGLLHITNTNVSGQSLKSLRKLKGLDVLYPDGTLLTHKHLRDLKQSFPRLKIFPFTPSPSQQFNKYVRRLHFIGGDLHRETRHYDNKIVKESVFQFSYNDDIDNKYHSEKYFGIPAEAEEEKEKLYFRHIKEAAEIFTKLPDITKVYFRGRYLTEKILIEHPFPKTIKEIHVVQNFKMTKKLLEKISKLSKLTSIRFDNVEVKADDLAILSKCQKLKSIYFHKIGFTKKEKKSLKENFPNLHLSF